MQTEKNPVMPFAITVGEGRTNPKGVYLKCEPSVKAIASALRSQPHTVERWWSMHLWQNNWRKSDAWQASSGVAIDIDYRMPNENPSADLVERLCNAAASGDLPGNIFHTTPHGARIAFVYEKVNNDRDLQKKAERGAGSLVTKALEQFGLSDYQVDTAPIGDLARFFYTPDCVAKDVKRAAPVITIRINLVNPVDLSVHDVAVRPVALTNEKPVSISTDLDQAIVAWNQAHPVEYPRHSAPCPVCKDSGSFGHLPENPNRWYCFSTDHTTVGVRGDKGFHGDECDLEAFRRGCKPIDVAKADGYLAPKSAPNVQQKDTETDNVTEWRPRRSHSYCTAVDLIQKNERNILENRKLELNEMSGEIELGRKPIKDADAHRIRFLIEKKLSGGTDSKGNQVGLQLSSADVFAAITQVSHANSFHPVRDYLSTLSWDGLSRFSQVVNLLGAEENEINQILVKRFFVSAVARPIEPGCKVDTAFILVGRQGAKKSSFFATLSDPWFIDTPIDISGDPVRAYMTMRKAWILEWAELEALLRAKRDTAVKAFLSSKSDSYVPKHARYSIDVKRSGVIVGTTNSVEFLEDDSGERRYWPITVGDIQLDSIAKMRDQLWAEAVVLFKKGERWWLTEDEEKLLEPLHTKYKVSDVWAERVLSYATPRAAAGFTTSDVLREEIVKEVGQWNRGDEMRIAKILRLYGYIRTTDPNNLSRKVWKKVK